MTSLPTDLELMGAEGDIYSALERMIQHFQSLHDHSHLLSYKSDDPVDVNFRKSFYNLLIKINESHQSLIRLFELMCDIHQSEYK